MFGGLAAAWRHKRGFRGYRGIARAYYKGRFYRRRPYGRRIANTGYHRRLYARPRRPLTSANRVETVIHRLEQQFTSDTGPEFMQFKSAATDVHDHLAVALSNMPGSGPYKELYHFFRIVKVCFIFQPVAAQGLMGPTSGTDNSPAITPYNRQYCPNLYTAINRAAAAFAQTSEQMMSTNNVKWVTAGNYHKREFVPSILGQGYQSAVETAYDQLYKTWLSTEDTSTPWFGLDVVLGGTPAPPEAYKYRVITIATVQYKNRKANTDLS